MRMKRTCLISTFICVDVLLLLLKTIERLIFEDTCKPLGLLSVEAEVLDANPHGFAVEPNGSIPPLTTSTFFGGEFSLS